LKQENLHSQLEIFNTLVLDTDRIRRRFSKSKAAKEDLKKAADHFVLTAASSTLHPELQNPCPLRGLGMLPKTGHVPGHRTSLNRQTSKD
jgi:hypothetical protein